MVAIFNGNSPSRGLSREISDHHRPAGLGAPSPWIKAADTMPLRWPQLNLWQQTPHAWWHSYSMCRVYRLCLACTERMSPYKGMTLSATMPSIIFGHEPDNCWMCDDENLLSQAMQSAQILLPPLRLNTFAANVRAAAKAGMHKMPPKTAAMQLQVAVQKSSTASSKADDKLSEPSQKAVSDAELTNGCCEHDGTVQQPTCQIDLVTICTPDVLCRQCISGANSTQKSNVHTALCKYNPSTS